MSGNGTIDQPVPSAFDRSTDSVPSTTQKPCCSPVRCAMKTAIASPAAPRTLFWNHTDPKVACSTASCSVASIAASGGDG